MIRDFQNEKLLNIQQGIIIDVDYVEDLRHMWEILEFVEYVWENMLEKVWLWVLKRLVGS